MRYPTTLRTTLAETYCVPTSFAAFNYAAPPTLPVTTDTNNKTATGGGGIGGGGGTSGLPQDVYIPPPALELFYLVSRFELGKLSVRDRQFLTKVNNQSN